MINSIFIGPYHSNSLAGIVFRRFLAGAKALGVSTPAFTYPSITAARYKPTAQEEIEFVQLSASKEIHESLAGAPNAGIIFMDTIPQDEFLAQFSTQGLQPAVVVLCNTMKTKALEQVAKRLEQYNIELVTLQEPGRKSSAAALWTARLPIQPAISNPNPELDTLLFDGALQSLPDVIEKSASGKTIYLYDPFDFASLKPPIMEAMDAKMKEKGVSLKSFSFHTEEELLSMASGKGIVVNGDEMSLLLGAVAEDKDNWIRRSEIMLADFRAILHTKFPQPIDAPTYKEVPDLPEGLKGKGNDA